MAVTSIHTPEIDESKYSLPIENGGTSARSPEQAAENLGLVSTDQVDQYGGIALLGPDNLVQVKNYPLSFVTTDLPVFFGDHEFLLGEELSILITNYSSEITYTIDPAQMQNTAYRMEGDRVILSSSNGITGTQTLVVNGREFHFEIIRMQPSAPVLANVTWSDVGGLSVLTDNIPFEHYTFTSSEFVDPWNMFTHGSTRWEISTNPEFTTLAFNSYNPIDKDSWTVYDLDPDATYYIRLAHVSSDGVSSKYSQVFQFRTAIYLMVAKPLITSPISDTTGNTVLPLIQATTFTPIGFSPVHIATDWQISTTPDFSSIYESSMNDSVNKTSWTPSTLGYMSIYYIRVRYRGDIAGSSGSPYSEWSNTVKITTAADARSIQKPVAMMAGDIYTDISPSNPSFTGSAFTPVNYTDTHVSSEWQIATDVNFGTIVHDSNWVNNLVTYNPTLQLTEAVTHYARVRYKGNIKISDWSDPVMFATGIYFHVNALGGGAGGGGGSTNGSWVNATGAAGGGGGGGGVSKFDIGVTPGITYSLTVGGGGAGGGGAGAAGGVGGTTSISVPGYGAMVASGGNPGNGGSQSSAATPGGSGGWGNLGTGGHGGQGGSMHADTGGGSYYAAATDGGGLVGGLLGRSDLAYGYGAYGGGGGGSPTIQVPGVTYRGGQGYNNSSYPHNGLSGSGGGGAAYIGGAGGAGGAGAVVVEYASSAPMLNTTGAIYELVNGMHRYTWNAAGNYQYTIAEGVYVDSEHVSTPTVSSSSGTSTSPTFNSSVFVTDFAQGSHIATDWQMASDAAFTNIIASSINDTVNKLSWARPGLNYSTTYYVRCRHRSKFDVSDWSNPLTYTTMADNRYIATPYISGSTIYNSTTFSTSAFTPVNFSGVLEGVDWQWSYEPNFTYFTTGNSASEQWGVINLPAGYIYVRARHRSQGITSGWSPTLEYYVPSDGGG